MKKIFYLLFFLMNTCLVAGDEVVVHVSRAYHGISDILNYEVKNRALTPAASLLQYAFSSCCESKKNSDGSLVKADDKPLVNVDIVKESFTEFFKFGRQSVTLKDVIMSSTNTQKLGYGVFAAFAFYGAIQVGFAIKNRLRKIDESRNTVD